jgi:hypothetical protein
MTKTEERPKAPKTPSPGQMRMAAKAIDESREDHDSDSLESEALAIVRDWLRYQATLKAAAR